MKLKPLHWVLIAILLIEAIVLGAMIGTNMTSQNTSPNKSELLVTYTSNEKGQYELLSIFAEENSEPISFKADGNTYTTDKSISEITEAYRNFNQFEVLFPNATKGMWSEYKFAVDAYIDAKLKKEHPVMEYVRGIASKWYGVNHELLYNNSGFYTINTETTINAWESIFKSYQIKENNNAINEMALGATVVIDDISYNAIAYMVVSDDGDAKNNSTAKEVSVHIVFGDKFMKDITGSTAMVYYLNPDGTTYIGHSEIPIVFMADTVEARYRDLAIAGGQ
jgi:hypothetical protein